MLSGEPYNVLDPFLISERYRVRALCQKINLTAIRTTIFVGHFASKFSVKAATLFDTAPFFCYYGSNIGFGMQVFLNFNSIILDACPVRIGDYMLLGPGIQILTPMHPLDAAFDGKSCTGSRLRLGQMYGWEAGSDQAL
ncbi:maltose acetyltransferase domain-containing protein [Mesorhizobium sp. 43Arga]